MCYAINNNIITVLLYKDKSLAIVFLHQFPLYYKIYLISKIFLNLGCETYFYEILCKVIRNINVSHDSCTQTCCEISIRQIRVLHNMSLKDILSSGSIK